MQQLGTYNYKWSFPLKWTSSEHKSDNYKHHGEESRRYTKQTVLILILKLQGLEKHFQFLVYRTKHQAVSTQ